MSEEKDAI